MNSIHFLGRCPLASFENTLWVSSFVFFERIGIAAKKLVAVGEVPIVSTQRKTCGSPHSVFLFVINHHFQDSVLGRVFPLAIMRTENVPVVVPEFPPYYFV